MTHPLIQLIAGPTASGKSRLALETAERNGAVILNADSQQLYADLRILSARPTAEDEARAEHRLYGIADAADAWSVGRWSRAVMPVLAELAAAGRPALLVGGTGLYFNALTRGLADIPDIPDSVRDEISALYDSAGEGSVRRRLVEADPESEAAIASGDRQRLIRALAVLTVTGQPLSVWRADTRPLLAEGSWEAVVIEPPRDQLYAACDARVATMVEQGALDEVRALVARRLDPTLPAMKAVGVRDFAAHLRGEVSLAEAITAVQQATRNYAKRQLTWFRNQTPDWRRAPTPA
mgnify:FL=1